MGGGVQCDTQKKIIEKSGLKIGSLNVRGIGDKVKRRQIFNWLRMKKMSIYFIREAHCTEDNKHEWRAERGYQGPVPRKPINANLRLKINQAVYFSTPKCCSTQIFGRTLHEKTSILKNKNKQKKLSPKS